MVVSPGILDDLKGWLLTVCWVAPGGHKLPHHEDHVPRSPQGIVGLKTHSGRRRVEEKEAKAPGKHDWA